MSDNLNYRVLLDITNRIHCKSMNDWSITINKTLLLKRKVTKYTYTEINNLPLQVVAFDKEGQLASTTVTIYKRFYKQ